jgi:hypothetical protein
MRYFKRADGRLYSIFPPARDLLGDWVVLTTHGSVWSRQGGIKAYPAADHLAAVKLEAAIAKTRLRHGYSEQPV